MSLRERIHNALVTVTAAWDFPVVEHGDDDTITVGPTTVKYDSIALNETGAQFNSARLNKREYLRERVSWQWMVKLGFSQEVSLEDFERSLTDSPIILPQTGTDDRTVLINLDNTRYEHPTRGTGGGTKAVLVFTAILTPI